MTDTGVEFAVEKIFVKDDGLVAEFYRPQTAGRVPAIIALGGSDGGLPARSYAERLARRGFAVLALAYFGLPELPPQLAAMRPPPDLPPNSGIEKLPPQLEEIPLEYFKVAIDWLRHHSTIDGERIGLIGISKGAEAALLVAAHYPEIVAVIAAVPSNVVWPGVNWSALTSKSSWSLAGRPLPCLPFDLTPPLAGNPYARSLAHLDRHKDAIIPVEQINGPILLISGVDDKLWPSADMADRVMARLRERGFGFPHDHLRYEAGGHWVFGAPLDVHDPMARNIAALGGTIEGNLAARNDSWGRALRFLHDSLKR